MLVASSNINMMYISALLLIMSIWFGIKSIKDQDQIRGFFAIAILFTSLGTAVITYFALTMINL